MWIEGTRSEILWHSQQVFGKSALPRRMWKSMSPAYLAMVYPGFYMLPLVGSVLVSKPSDTARVICSTSQVVQVSITCGEGHMIRRPCPSSLGSGGFPAPKSDEQSESSGNPIWSLEFSECALTSKHLRNPCFLSSMWVNCTSKYKLTNHVLNFIEFVTKHHHIPSPYSSDCPNMSIHESDWQYLWFLIPVSAHVTHWPIACELDIISCSPNLSTSQKCFEKIPSSKKSPTGPTERTPKPEYLIALATYLGVHW